MTLLCKIIGQRRPRLLRIKLITKPLKRDPKAIDFHDVAFLIAVDRIG